MQLDHPVESEREGMNDKQTVRRNVERAFQIRRERNGQIILCARMPERSTGSPDLTYVQGWSKRWAPSCVIRDSQDGGLRVLGSTFLTGPVEVMRGPGEGDPGEGEACKGGFYIIRGYSDTCKCCCIRLGDLANLLRS